MRRCFRTQVGEDVSKRKRYPDRCLFGTHWTALFESAKVGTLVHAQWDEHPLLFDPESNGLLRAYLLSPGEALDIEGKKTLFIGQEATPCAATAAGGEMPWKIWTKTPTPNGEQYGYALSKLSLSQDLTYGLMIHW